MNHDNETQENFNDILRLLKFNAILRLLDMHVFLNYSRNFIST